MSLETCQRFVILKLVFLMASIGAQPAPAQDEDRVMEEVIVTGTRIKRTDIESLSPISVFDEAALKASGDTTLERFLLSIPSVSGADFSSNINLGNPGYSTVSLRGLGPNRTLVLLNGHRLPSTGVLGFVDMNLIPSSAIERVEVLRDGASTIYGSDAIAGVVNLITKTDLDGIEMEARYGQTSEGDGENYLASLTFGKSFSRWDFMVSAQYQRRDEIQQRDRDFSECAIGELDGEKLCLGSGITYPAQAYTALGPQIIDSDTGLARAYDPRTDSYNWAQRSLMVPPQETRSVFGSINYDLVEDSAIGDINFFLEALYSNRQSEQIIAPAGTFWLPIVRATNPGNAWGTPVLLSRRLDEAPGRTDTQDADAWRSVIGMRGELNNGWSWEVSYNYAGFEADDKDEFRAMPGRFETLLDPEKCATDPDCPGVWDPFHVNTFTPEMRAYALANPRGSFDSKLKVWSAHLTGELDLLTLQGGIPEWVIGFERREERGGGSTDDSRVLAGEVFGYSGRYTQGDYSVNEWFGEVRLPFIFGKRFAEVVTAEVSFRVSDYDILSGKEDVWKYALEWAPTSDVRLRYTYSQGFRAPKIAEYAAGEGVGLPTYNDPCIDWGNNPDSVIRDNCAADGLPTNFSPDTFQAPSLIGGNPELEPEESVTHTYGIVFTPSFFDGFSATLDYFMIEIDDSIGTLGVNELITSCYESPNFSSPSCALILGPEAIGVTPSPNAPTRRSASQNVAGADLRLGNLASFEIKGWDFAVSYAVYGILGGSLDLTLLGTYLDSYEYDAGPGYPALNLAGSFGTEPYLGRVPAAFPEWKANITSTYSRQNWGVSYFLRWLDGVDDITGSDCGLSCDVDAYFYHDINGYYDWGNTTFSFGVRNLFDKDPPYVTNYADMNTLNLNYDTSGRYFYTGISMRF